MTTCHIVRIVFPGRFAQKGASDRPHAYISKSVLEVFFQDGLVTFLHDLPCLRSKLIDLCLDKKDMTGSVKQFLQEFKILLSSDLERIEHEDNGVCIRYKPCGNQCVATIERP